MTTPCTDCTRNLKQHSEVAALLTDPNREWTVQYNLCESVQCEHDPYSD